MSLWSLLAILPAVLAQTTPEALVVEVVSALHATVTRPVAPKLPRDQISGTCACARGSLIRLEDTRGRVLAEQTLTDAVITFTEVKPGEYVVIAEDGVTKQKLTVRGVRPGTEFVLTKP